MLEPVYIPVKNTHTGSLRVALLFTDDRRRALADMETSVVREDHWNAHRRPETQAGLRSSVLALKVIVVGTLPWYGRWLGSIPSEGSMHPLPGWGRNATNVAGEGSIPSGCTMC